MSVSTSWCRPSGGTTGRAIAAALSRLLRRPRGEAERALGGFGNVIDALHRSAAWPQLWTTVRSLAEALVQLGRYEEAAVLLGVVEGGGTRPVVRGADLPRLERTRAALVTALGADRVKALLADGAALDDNRAVQRALEAAGPAADQSPA